MASTINPNVTSFSPQSNLNVKDTALNKAIQQVEKTHAASHVSSAKNPSAKEIALQLTEKKKTIAAMQTAQKNSQDTVAVLQKADAGLEKGGKMLDNLKSLATKAKDENLSAEDRAAATEEFNTTLQDYKKLMNEENYSRHKLFDGKFDLVTVPSKEKDRSISFGDFRSESLGLDDLSIDSVEGATKALEKLQSASDKVTAKRGEIKTEVGAVEKKLNEDISSIASNYNPLKISEAAKGKKETQAVSDNLNNPKDFRFTKNETAILKSQMLMQASQSLLNMHQFSSQQNIMSLFR